MRIASVVVEMLLLQVPQRARIIPTFGSARGATAGTARRRARRRHGASDITDQQIGSVVIAQFSCKILPFFPRALRLAAARP